MKVAPASARDPKRQRLLFVAEAVTLAHVARPTVLAQALDPAHYDIHFACEPRYLTLFGNLPFTVHLIDSITPERFRDALAKGQPLYDVATLRSYVKDDLRLIDMLSPDVIVGDFRLSLSVSARIAGIPYVAITNAHWSPYAKPRFLVPELAVTDRLGARTAQLLFSLMRPLIFVHQALPFNRIRREYGLPFVGRSLSQVFTDADETLYADLPELVPTFHRSPTHRYLGPILWSPVLRPPWWDALPAERPAVYVNLGDSGRSDLLPIVLEAVADLGLFTLAATAGKGHRLRSFPDHVRVADYLPGIEAASRVDLMICNGGSASVYQAFAAGVPVLGIPTNLDQYLMMSYISRAGAGKLVRAGEASTAVIRKTVTCILQSSDYRRRAESLKGHIAAARSEDRFVDFLARRFDKAVPHRDCLVRA
jgi:UDP:flavonoid glycosyltransferase YjiC (YdhE family)